MSVNKHYREQWIAKVYAEAVQLFHEARKANEDDTPLADLARACANTAFQKYAALIVGDGETMAREFMAHCREHFAGEIRIAMLANLQSALAETAAAVGAPPS